LKAGLRSQNNATNEERLEGEIPLAAKEQTIVGSRREGLRGDSFDLARGILFQKKGTDVSAREQM